MDKKNNLFYI